MLVDGHMCQHRSSFTVAHGEGRGTWRGEASRGGAVLLCMGAGAGAVCVRSATGTTGAGVACVWQGRKAAYLPIWVSFSGVPACFLTYANGHFLIELLTWQSLSAGI